MRAIALVVAGCRIVAAWRAEAVGEGGSQPTFRSGVELVTIDVVATDRSGKPVHDMKASDFELFEDGKTNGLWRIALSLKSPLPTGNLEVRVMRDELLLADSCLAQFTSR